MAWTVTLAAVTFAAIALIAITLAVASLIVITNRVFGCDGCAIGNSNWP